MPDFTNMDPSIIAEFWIYFVASLIGGFVLGIVLSKIFFNREKDLVRKQKEMYQEKEKEYEELERQLKKAEKELKDLKDDISRNRMYWNMKTQEGQQARGNKALYDMLHGQKE